MKSQPRPQIEFVILPDGTVEERVIGLKGRSCEDITQSVESALGEIARREHTGDYYDQQESIQVEVGS